MRLVLKPKYFSVLVDRVVAAFPFVGLSRDPISMNRIVSEEPCVATFHPPADNAEPISLRTTRMCNNHEAECHWYPCVLN